MAAPAPTPQQDETVVCPRCGRVLDLHTWRDPRSGHYLDTPLCIDRLPPPLGPGPQPPWSRRA